MISKALLLAFLLGFTISESAFAETYNDCILENMKGIGSREAAGLVMMACKSKVLPYEPAKCKTNLRPI